MRLVGVLLHHADELFIVELAQAVRRRDARLRIEPQVERAIRLVGEAALWIVDLHGRDAEVREHEIERANFFCQLVDLAEVHLAALPDIRAKALRADARLRLFRLDWVDVAAVEMTFALELLEHRERVAAVAERRIEAALARLYRENLEDLLDHDGDVRAGRRVALGAHMGNLLPVLLRIELLVLLREMARVTAAVMDAPLMRLLLLLFIMTFHNHASLFHLS